MAPGRIKRIIKANRKIFADYRQGAAAGGGVRGGISAAAGNVASSPLALIAQAIKKPTSLFWKGLTGNKSILGINVGVGAFLKQSQAFNTSVTSILQIIGALIDVAIAPFIIPLIVPLAKKMGSWVPAVSAYAKEVAADAVPKIKAMAQAVWSGDGNWLRKSAEIIIETLKILWDSSGLAKWWDDQTGFLGDFLGALEGIGNLIMIAYDAFKVGMKIRKFSKAATKALFNPVETAKNFGAWLIENPKEAAEKLDTASDYISMTGIAKSVYGYIKGTEKNKEASANMLNDAVSLSKRTWDAAAPIAKFWFTNGIKYNYLIPKSIKSGL